MKIPPKLKIGAHEYDVIRRDDMDDEDFGSCRQRKLKIFINDNVPQSLQEETMIHEALHSIYMQLGMGTPQGDDKEEQEVQALGHAIYQFLKDKNLLK